tara:strand:+ start:451 stop:1068 length:618 start_codon:yes stop_codon:yes gene_type:complete
MAIKVNIGNNEPNNIKVKINPDQDVDINVKETIKVNVTNSNKQLLEFQLMIRRALNGDLMIFDHSEIDIVVMPEKKKIVAFAKDIMSDSVYGAESRLFEHLKKKGVVAFDSIQGGNVYGSLEAKIHESKELDSIKATLYEISQWMDEERPYIDFTNSHSDEMEDHYLNPDEENSTELGEVPHEEQKGSILQRGLFAPYLYGKYTY